MPMFVAGVCNDVCNGVDTKGDRGSMEFGVFNACGATAKQILACSNQHFDGYIDHYIGGPLNLGRKLKKAFAGSQD